MHVEMDFRWGLDKEGKFGDIMLADILTSYAKVLGDLWVTGCMFLGGVSATSSTYVITEALIVEIIIFCAFFVFFIHSSSFFSYSSVAAVV